MYSPDAIITQLNVYPVKSCAGTSLDRVKVEERGLTGDRGWMIVNDAGRFLTQRESPRLALVKPILDGGGLRLSAPGMPDLALDAHAAGTAVRVRVWDDRCAAIDAGAAAATWASDFLKTQARLVRFDPSIPRLSDSRWTGGLAAQYAFADGFPILVISENSLADLNGRLDYLLPMNRFRPNIVLAGVGPYAEDRMAELVDGDLRLRMVKPCIRCAITTVEQTSGEFAGAEPLKTLKTYRWSRELRGVMFGQNAIIVGGIGTELRVGQELRVKPRLEE